MPRITFIDFSGASHDVEAKTGGTLMEAAIEAMVPGIEGDCGGNCICATCHVYVDPAWLARLPAPEGDEEAMIEYTSEPEDNSRLTCQLTVTDELDGMVVRIPETQY
ncbi:2Fe-2S iron-sulfur cluster-binding protein [Salinisphaera sp. P385]|uniref:2Fe-2S iron-sulfur cluster-binding protein n=1 Tax=Spectribacter acetivorans TaxID=3075603 RepID=A0ABU3B8Z6_9GAMM|nr:2Fe-2S iron-sulfur cluster-binding protein [Salinisphaera sp. P385]MDT0617446.1 2Fe-2S iron-sulfur cluster-binding protein [Salinisphaera sp. P385]